MSKLSKCFGTMALAFVVGSSLGGRAEAATVNFTASIDGAQETTCLSPTTAQGAATATLDSVSGMLSWNITFGNNSPSFNNGMLDNGAEILAHFHGPAAPGVTAGVKVTLGLGSPKVGSATVASPADRADLTNDLWYINIHSSGCSAGEIRGQVLRTPTCGDGVVDGPGEECDDGNNANGDGCDSTCQSEPAPPVPALSPLAVVVFVLLLVTLTPILLRRRSRSS
jgi:cysteine-rich repeat protein